LDAQAAAAVQPAHQVALLMPITSRCPPDKLLLRLKLAHILVRASTAEA
jgi:hypothetical protein